ncbi:hypothetical protein [Candidatus Cardinium sp. TP]|uniref:hypothetical protein n=1 Tax=Candidatus Cardinium sp. TP TaxID=2961955 RepID=UPI0021AEFFDC|nr:hypothetical protein [Candidatus Cardinium sp. TP]MDN5246718.1 hypothetical protein [Candidatus Cardinium sp.]
MRGESVTTSINKHLAFDILDKDDTSFWSLLLFAGYLKMVDAVFNKRNSLYDCTLAIPNQEVATFYNRFFEEWLLNKFPSRRRYDTFLNHLLIGKVNEFTRDLSRYLLQSASFFDVHYGKQSESFYHGFDP